MKSYILLSAVLPLLLFGEGENKEIAIILKNDEIYSVQDLELLKDDFKQFSQQLSDNQHEKVSLLLNENKEAILEGLASIGHQSLKELKSEISALALANLHQVPEASSSATQAGPASEPSSSLAPSHHAPSMDHGAPMKPIPHDQISQYRPSLERHYMYSLLDFLYWTAHEGQQSYVLPNFVAPPPGIGGVTPFSGNTAQIGDLKEFTYDWAPGYRIALGFNFSPDYWDLEAQYTYVHPEGSSSVTDPHPPTTTEVGNGTAGPFFVATLLEFTGNTVAAATASAMLNYQTADLLLSKRFKLSKQILGRFGMGGTAAFLSHHFNVDYIPLQPGLLDKHRHKWKFQGGGFKLGLETDWLMGAGVSLLGRFNAGLLYGAYKNKFLNEAFNGSGQVLGGLAPGLSYTVQDTRMSVHRFASTAQFALEASWGTRINECVDIQLFAGYEFNFWFNVHYFLHSDTESGVSGRNTRYANELLGLQGLTLGSRLNF
jgi:hypothetical protein